MEYDNTNRGAIFKNENKTKETQPDYRGTINVDGQEKQIALWIKTSKDETKQFFSAQISAPYVAPTSTQDVTPSSTQDVTPDLPPIADDLPF